MMYDVLILKHCKNVIGAIVVVVWWSTIVTIYSDHQRLNPDEVEYIFL